MLHMLENVNNMDTTNPIHQYDVIHLGPYFCDLIIAGLADLPQLGCEIYGTELHMVPGGAFNTTYALHRLELKTGWVSDFGSDHFSQFVLEKIKELGIDIKFFKIHDHPLCAVSVAFSFQHDRGFISYMDPCEPWNLIEILETYRPRIFLVGGLEYGPVFLDFAAAARQLGITLVMDCQYRDVTLRTPGVTEALSSVDLFMPNCCEAFRLTGIHDTAESASILAEYTPLVVIKIGREGSLAYSQGKVFRAPAIHVPKVFDTTGAGDSFNAGFLYGYLRGAPVETCLKYANLMGAACVTGFGVSQIPNRIQLETLLGDYDEMVAGAGVFPKQPSLGLDFSISPVIHPSG
jgi:sugar/nucleoside kinase (ribokinase family)